jgi:hypothetical protein
LYERRVPGLRDESGVLVVRARREGIVGLCRDASDELLNLLDDSTDALRKAFSTVDLVLFGGSHWRHREKNDQRERTGTAEMRPTIHETLLGFCGEGAPYIRGVIAKAESLPST